MEKKDKNLNVPNLRFPEFSGEWENKRIDEIAPLQRGFDLPTQEVEDGDYPVVYSNGILKHHKTYKCEAPGLVTGRSGSIGSFTYISDGKYWPHNTSLWVTDFKNNYPPFVYYLYQTINISQYASGSSVPTLNRNDVHRHITYLPTFIEQVKIAKLLVKIDERIDTQKKIIEDLKKLKYAISKQIFAQEPIGWNRLDTLFSKGKAGGTPTSTNKEFYNGDIPFLSINDITKQGKYIRYTENHLSQSGLENSSAWIIPQHSLIMSMYASVGLVTINEVPITTSQAMFAMQLKDKDLLDYLYYYLSYFKYRHIHKYLETGTQSNINADIVRGIMIPDYGHSMNIQIESTLQIIDAKIDNELAILEQFNSQKSYLLSQMFT